MNPLPPEQETVEVPQLVRMDEDESEIDTKELSPEEIQAYVQMDTETYRQWLDRHGIGCDEVSS